MSSEQPSAEPNLATITIDTPPIEPLTKPRAVRKRKGPDTSQEVDNSPSRSSAYRNLAPQTQAPNPTEQFSSSCSRGKPLGHQGSYSTRPSLLICPCWGTHLEEITSLVVELSLIFRNARAIMEPFYDVLRYLEELVLQSENLQRSYLGLKKCVQPSLVAWQSHLHQINSLVVAISQIPQVFTPAITQFLDVDMGMLSHQSESLQKSYFALKEMVQQ